MSMISINEIRAQSAALDKNCVNVGLEGEVSAAGGKCIWIKSLLGIGHDRDVNRLTNACLKSAVLADRRCARASEQVDALFGTLSPKTPLTGRKIVQLLDQIEAAAQQAEQSLIATNQALLFTYGTLELGKLDEYAITCGGSGFQLDPAEKKALADVISARLYKDAGDFTGDSIHYQANIRATVRNSMREFVNLRVTLDGANLPEEERAALKGQIFEDGDLVSRQSFEQRVRLRDNMFANDALKQELADLSSADSPLPAALAKALSDADLVVELPTQARHGMAAAIEAAIEKAGKHGEHRLTRDEGQAIMEEEVGKFVETFSRLYSNSPVDLTTDYLQALAEIGADIPVAAFNNMAAAETPAQLLESIENMRQTLAPVITALASMPQHAGGEDVTGSLEHGLALSLAYAGVNKDKAGALFAWLNTPMGKDMRSLLHFAAAGSPVMDGAKQALLTVMKALGHVAGLDVQAFMSEEQETPVPANALDFPLDIRSMLPDFYPLAANVHVPVTPDYESVLPAAAQKFARGVSDGSRVSMLTHLKKLEDGSQVPDFDKDVVQPGVKITIGGKTLDPHTAIPMESLLRDGEDLIDDNELTARREAAAVTNAYNAFAQFVTGRNDALFENLTPNETKKALLLICMADHNAASSAYNMVLPELFPNYSNLANMGDPRVTFTNKYMLSIPEDLPMQRDVEFDMAADGDIVIRTHCKQPVDSMYWQDGSTVELDPTRSSKNFAATLSISQAELERLSELNWQHRASRFEFKEEARIRFSEQSIVGGLDLFTAQ